LLNFSTSTSKSTTVRWLLK